MKLTMLKAKIHRARVTQCELTYEGSLTIDENLLEASGILPYEQIDVLNINSGHRFTTYAIKGERGSGIIGVNGAAARLCQTDDLVIICAYGQMKRAEAESHTPTVIFVDDKNAILPHLKLASA